MIAYFDKMVDFNRRLVRALKAEGVPMLAGSDALTSGVVGGFSLHEELVLLVDAGLTNEEAIASATRLPAVWMGVDGDRGTIEAGKRADLVLLDPNPLADIANSRRIAGVFSEWPLDQPHNAGCDDGGLGQALCRDQRAV